MYAAAKRATLKRLGAARSGLCARNDGLEPQSGDFYGGWITSRIVGPFKGGPGTLGW